ncbi:YgiW/YdeI family stress tolerance OB fold protein [Nissabacter sp. SGAir0207]|uniref:YgiW/YdeI family stress tolerance OB fold protein n=1 Tax=Nissabacter sp. SGAir0207 TaxID=2126321 RepID=UPI00143D3A7E|nr:YgiW/YdeI family stress tolerance OB fold protein [Nissabacter sp. SGAir0207]
MKKMTIAALLALMTLPAFAEDNGGFKAEGTAPPQEKHDSGLRGTEDARGATIELARTMHEDAWVTLEGYITKESGTNQYHFRDKTGTINIQVDEKRWNGDEVTPEDLVMISGRVKHKGNSTMVAVEHLEKQ